MDILNFISWIKGGRQVNTVNSTQTLIPVGLKDPKRDDGYLAGAITVSDLASQLGSDRLVAGTKEVVLTEVAGEAVLTFSQGRSIIQTTGSNADLYIRTLTGDDILLESGDDIVLRGDKGLYDDEAEGGDINIYAGDGSDGDTQNSGDGGDIRIEAGDGGFSNLGSQGDGGAVSIRAGYTNSLNAGGSVYISAGGSNSGAYGEVVIGDAFVWRFNEGDASFLWPSVTLATLPNAAGVAGARAMIGDSSVAALGNFGAIALGGGSNIVPVFSDGAKWLIG